MDINKYVDLVKKEDVLLKQIQSLRDRFYEQDYVSLPDIHGKHWRIENNILHINAQDFDNKELMRSIIEELVVYDTGDNMEVDLHDLYWKKNKQTKGLVLYWLCLALARDSS